MRRKVEGPILQAAIKLFGLYSAKGVTTRAIAKEAKVLEPAIYMWFKSKENLYAEAVNAVVAEAKKDFSRFVYSILVEPEEPTPARIADAVRTWCASIPTESARLLVQVRLNDPKHASLAREPFDQIIATLAKALVRQKKTNRKFDPQAAAEMLIRTIFWGKVLDNPKNTERDMERQLQQWLLALAPG